MRVKRVLLSCKGLVSVVCAGEVLYVDNGP